MKIIMRKVEVYKVEELRDLYKIQISLQQKNLNSKIKWALQELANNVIEYEEKAKILLNKNSIIVSIALNSITEESIKIIKASIDEIKKNKGNFIKNKSKNNYEYGGYGLRSIFKMGFSFRMVRTEESVLLICRLKGDCNV
jgi:hypothetical protein